MILNLSAIYWVLESNLSIWIKLSRPLFLPNPFFIISSVNSGIGAIGLPQPSTSFCFIKACCNLILFSDFCSHFDVVFLAFSPFFSCSDLYLLNTSPVPVSFFPAVSKASNPIILAVVVSILSASSYFLYPLSHTRRLFDCFTNSFVGSTLTYGLSASCTISFILLFLLDISILSYNGPPPPNFWILPPPAYLPTLPPPLLFILCKLSAPRVSTAFLRITNSPGSNIALTVSPLPWPGTTPPLANFLTKPPLFNPALGGNWRLSIMLDNLSMLAVFEYKEMVLLSRAIT